MAILKLVKDEYRNTDAINNLISYILNPEKMPSKCYGGNGISLLSPIESMYAVKQMFDQSTGKQAEHFILAFNKNELKNITLPLLYQIGYEICNWFTDIQILFAVHEVKNTYYSDDYEDDCVHIHFVVNTINLRSGKKFRIDYNNSFDLRNYIEAVLFNYNVSDKVYLAAG